MALSGDNQCNRKFPLTLGLGRLMDIREITGHPVDKTGYCDSKNLSFLLYSKRLQIR